MSIICGGCKAENASEAEVCFTCGKSLTVTKGTLIGSRYEIQERLGKGGFGTVYRAYDRDEEEIVAIKILRQDIGSPDLLKRFRRESAEARKVDHKNVCRVLEDGEDGHVRYITMAFVKGVTLREVLRIRAPLPSDESYNVIFQITAGLAAIHSQGIVHRDLKPENIMRTPTGLVKIMDFGLAKPLDPSVPPLTAGIVGSPPYVSPEQIHRKTTVDKRSDLYSLGIMIYEMFTGHPPFRRENIEALLRAHLLEEPPLEKEDLIPEALDVILRRALAKDPANRYPTVETMAAALRDAQAVRLPAMPRRSRSSLATQPAVQTNPQPSPEPSVVPTPVLAPTPVAAHTPAGLDSPTLPRAVAVVSSREVPAGTLIGLRGWRTRWPAAVAVLLAAGAGWIVLRPDRPATDLAGLPGAAMEPPAVVAPWVRLNALPWARLTLTPVDRSVQLRALPQQPLVTPVALALPEGDYLIALENGGITPALTERIRVEAGRPNEFVFTMPSFDAETALPRMGPQ